MKLQGNAFVYGANVDTDVIIPARYLNTADPAVLASHCMEDIDPSFAGSVKPGDMIVAGANFGCGSSREHAPIAIKGAGVSCVIATSFARIFYRNAINMGLPILECAEASEIAKGDLLEVDIDSGRIVSKTSGKSYQAQPFPPFVRGIMEAGGLMKTLKRKSSAENQPAPSDAMQDAVTGAQGQKPS